MLSRFFRVSQNVVEDESMPLDSDEMQQDVQEAILNRDVAEKPVERIVSRIRSAPFEW